MLQTAFLYANGDRVANSPCRPDRRCHCRPPRWAQRCQRDPATKKGKWVIKYCRVTGECQQIISIQAKQQSKQLQRNKENAPKTLFPRQSENFKQRKKLWQRHEMRTGRGRYTDSVTLKRQHQHEHHLSLLCSVVCLCKQIIKAQ